MCEGGEMEASEKAVRHTPGPWEEVEGGVIAAFEGPPVAAIISAHTNDAESEANGRLICAAPALLAACREGRTALALAMQVLHEHSLDNEFLDRAAELKDGIGTRMREAIAKAEASR